MMRAVKLNHRNDNSLTMNSIVDPKYRRTLVRAARDFIVDCIMDKARVSTTDYNFRSATLMKIGVCSGVYAAKCVTGVAFNIDTGEWTLCCGAPVHGGELMYFRIVDVVSGIEESARIGVCDFIDRMRAGFNLLGYSFEILKGERRGERYVKLRLSRYC